jgi:hypothetical protein
MSRTKKAKLTFEDRVMQILNGENGRSISGSLENGFVAVNAKNEKHEIQMFDEFNGVCDCANFRFEGRGDEGFQCKHKAAASSLIQKQMEN